MITEETLPPIDKKKEEQEKRDAEIIAALDGKFFNRDSPPPEEPWLFKLAGVEIAHPCNIMVVTAKVKSGKSSALSAMLASLFSVKGADCLGFEGRNTDGKAVIHIDSEQSPRDHWEMMMRMIRRSGALTEPDWFRSVSLVSLPPFKRKDAVFALARDAKKDKGLHTLVIDGIADLIEDVNDPEQSNAIIGELHALACETFSHIVVVIHQNPNSEKMRGHLGSGIERKAESVLRLSKTDEVITLIADPTRKASITGDRAPRFEWSYEHGMHMSCAPKESPRTAKKRDEFVDLAREVMSPNVPVSWAELQTRLMKARDLSSKKDAENRITAMKRTGVIKIHSPGLYILA